MASYKSGDDNAAPPAKRVRMDDATSSSVESYEPNDGRGVAQAQHESTPRSPRIQLIDYMYQSQPAPRDDRVQLSPSSASNFNNKSGIGGNNPSSQSSATERGEGGNEGILGDEETTSRSKYGEEGEDEDEDELVWVCDICNTKYFESYEEACGHERTCTDATPWIEGDPNSLPRRQYWPRNLSNSGGPKKSWLERMEDLCEFKKKFGHTMVPQHYHEDSSLGRWVMMQRTEYRHYKAGKRSSMNAEKIEKLEEVGMIWNVNEFSWERRFAELSAYKNAHGNCLVPRSYPANPQLANWVHNQEKQYKLFLDGKKSVLSQEKKTKLDEIGFVWTRPSGSNG